MDKSKNSQKFTRNKSYHPLHADSPLPRCSIYRKETHYRTNRHDYSITRRCTLLSNIFARRLPAEAYSTARGKHTSNRIDILSTATTSGKRKGMEKNWNSPTRKTQFHADSLIPPKYSVIVSKFIRQIKLMFSTFRLLCTSHK